MDVLGERTAEHVLDALFAEGEGEAAGVDWYPPGTRERGAASARLEEPVPQLQLQPLAGGSRLSAHSRGNNIDIEGARQRDEGC